MIYTDFLKTKRGKSCAYGKSVSRDDIHSLLFDFQKDLVTWAARNLKEAEDSKAAQTLFDMSSL